MYKRIAIWTLSLCCIGAQAVAQKDSPHRTIKLVPTSSGHFKVIYLDDTLSTTAILNKKLHTVSACFYQISDSLLTFPDSDIPSQYFYGSLRNSFSDKSHLSMSYFIRPNKYSGGTSNSSMDETNRLSSLVDSINVVNRDSIMNEQYEKFIATRLTQNVLSNGDSCFSKQEAIIHSDYDKAILNADSVVIIQSILPTYGTCALGLLKEVILYKKSIGYIGLQYSLYKDWNRKITFQEASDLLDIAITQTWGIIRFNKE